MARFTASTRFNIDDFDLSTFTAGATSAAYNPADVPVGLKNYDGRYVVTDATAPRGQLIAFLEDETRGLVDEVEVFTGGTVGLLQFNVGFGATGWSPAFRISSIDASLVDYVAMIESPDATDDRAWLDALLSGNDQINMSVFADKMDGGAGNDLMNGNGGADTLLGGDGNDTVDGALGADNVSGNLGDDNLMGGRGADNISGGQGNDTIAGGAGNDNLNGGTGIDIFDFKRTDGNDVVEDYDDTQDFFRVDVLNPGAAGMTKVQDGDDVIVTFAGVANFSITIRDMDADNIFNSDFIYV